MEERIRMAAFDWLEQQTLYDDLLSWETLQQGFQHQGHTVSFVGPQGIWKPRAFSEIPLSVRTSPRGPYDDSLTSEGFLVYKYRGKDPYHHDNVGLRKAMVAQVPLIYFYGVVPGKYLAVWPVFVVNDYPEELSFIVAVDDKSSVQGLLKETGTKEFNGQMAEDSLYYRRQYITSAIKARLHQRSFRERVLEAYNCQCAFCRLKHSELLDAAHIIPDGEELGDPIVNNGLSLCKIHHAAFDKHFLGVNSDYHIMVRTDLLKERDGSMLKQTTSLFDSSTHSHSDKIISIIFLI
jgi:putative restriction endonuclease